MEVIQATALATAGSISITVNVLQMIPSFVPTAKMRIPGRRPLEMVGVHRGEGKCPSLSLVSGTNNAFVHSLFPAHVHGAMSILQRNITSSSDYQD